MKASREDCVTVYELYEGGEESSVEIEYLTGISDSTIKNWLSHPTRFDPYIDEIAVRRALIGDKGAYQALTVWEKDEFMDRLIEERKQTGKDSWEWQLRFDELHKQLGIKTDALKRAMMRRESA